ncbi:MAG: hypothetical protein GF334_03015 [Candidatus Altiarchaeales archaeon]|nr:hypothetical protein [Candidatus Altiarchaeales archaeon]
MGKNIKILAEREVDQTLYYDHQCNLELRECIHDHVEDFRMVYTEDEFLDMSDHWIAARKAYEDKGRPRCHDDLADHLSTKVLKGDRLHHNRLAVEFTEGGADKDGGGDTIHVHYRNNRIHLTKRDFYRMCLVFEEARRAYNIDFATKIKLSDPNVIIRDVARNKLIPWLEEYIADESIPREDPDRFWDMFLEQKDLIRPKEIQRPKGGFIGFDKTTRDLPESFNRRYTHTVYECMKKYGYAEGPFKYDYVRAHRAPNGKLEIAGSHRAAALVVLGYDEVPVTITN